MPVEIAGSGKKAPGAGHLMSELTMRTWVARFAALVPAP
jgi:hypothetical protein